MPSFRENSFVSLHPRESVFDISLFYFARAIKLNKLSKPSLNPQNADPGVFIFYCIGDAIQIFFRFVCFFRDIAKEIMKILIVEDEEELLSSIINYLQEASFECDFALHVKEARMKMSKVQYDCFVIDISLPDGSGLDLINDIKKQPHQPGSLIISAHNSTDHKVAGLNLGADDYLTKPFELSELNARLNSVLRRYRPPEKNTMVFNEIKVCMDTFQVFINSQEVYLTKKEYELLVYFITNRNKVISKHAIVSHLWGDYQDSQGSFDFLYAQIKNLRKKISAGGGKDYIQNINRIGYRFRAA